VHYGDQHGPHEQRRRLRDDTLDRELGTWTATASPGITPKRRKAAAQRPARSTGSPSVSASPRAAL
jgi:hypothetical protein